MGFYYCKKKQKRKNTCYDFFPSAFGCVETTRKIISPYRSWNKSAMDFWKDIFFLADLEGEVTFYSVLINYLKVLSTDFLCITPTFWSFENASSLHIMALRVVGFLSWGYKIRNIFPKNQHTQRKLLNFENWVNGGGVKKCQILTFKVNFLV